MWNAHKNFVKISSEYFYFLMEKFSQHTIEKNNPVVASLRDTNSHLFTWVYFICCLCGLRCRIVWRVLHYNLAVVSWWVCMLNQSTDAMADLHFGRRHIYLISCSIARYLAYINYNIRGNLQINKYNFFAANILHHFIASKSIKNIIKITIKYSREYISAQLNFYY